jgi:aspartate/methionine/tyrosine aminotransferase
VSEHDENQARATSLSARGARAAAATSRPDQDAFYEAQQNLYHATDNPGGAITLNVAENTLGWAALKLKIEEVTANQPLPDWLAKYTNFAGHPDVRQAVATFMTKHLTGCSIDPDLLVLTAGAMSAIDISAHVLGDPGDVVVIPSPSYPVYTHDLGARAELIRYDLITHHDVAEISDGPLLTTTHLDEALADIETTGQRFRLVILTTPDNPTGGMYDRPTLEAIADWCIGHRIHLIVNEIYGLSRIDTEHPELVGDYRGDPVFASFAQILEDRNSDYLHYGYALSKDFGVSGFRVGLMYSRNEEFISAFGLLNTFSMTSNLTQWVVQSILEDDAFVTSFIADNRSRLTESYLDVVRVLRRCEIPYVPSRGGLFVWADLSELLTDDTAEAAHDLWQKIYTTTGVLLTPGEGFGHTKHGMFRIVYSGVDEGALAAAMDRLEHFIIEERGSTVV